mgnify:CR=1 FL=1
MVALKILLAGRIIKLDLLLSLERPRIDLLTFIHIDRPASHVLDIPESLKRECRVIMHCIIETINGPDDITLTLVHMAQIEPLAHAGTDAFFE